MKVNELINKLNTFYPNDEVMIMFPGIDGVTIGEFFFELGKYEKDLILLRYVKIEEEDEKRI